MHLRYGVWVMGYGEVTRQSPASSNLESNGFDNNLAVPVEILVIKGKVTSMRVVYTN